MEDNVWKNFHGTKSNRFTKNTLNNSSVLKILQTNLLKAKQTLKLQEINNFPMLSFRSFQSKSFAGNISGKIFSFGENNTKVQYFSAKLAITNTTENIYKAFSKGFNTLKRDKIRCFYA